MLFFAFADEQDKDPDEEDIDADNDDNSDEDEDDSDEDDADEDSDDSDESDEDEDDEEDEDNKPVTRKELRELLKSNKNNRNANRRISEKNNKGRVTKQPSDADQRLAALEKQSQETALLERKRTFGYENGLSPKQVNHVFRLTKRPTAKFLNKPQVKAALEAIKSQENVGKNTPRSSGQRFRSPSNKTWTEMKPEERQSNLAARRQEILSRNSNRR